MAFSESISRLQRIIGFISINYRSKKEIMAYLRNYNIIISYKTLERDLKQIKEELCFDLKYERNVGYRCKNEKVVQTVKNTIDPKNCRIGYENDVFKIINVFDYNGINYCNCWDKISNDVFLIM
jgi:hypothetical protein